MTYAGDITPREAYALVRDEPATVLVDVRTKEEWAQVGVPDLDDVDKQVVFIEWLQGPTRQGNPAFLEELAAAVPEGSTLLMLCRSGVRSIAAADAATAAGMGPAYNVVEGFEGGAGWVRSGLPWRQQ